MKVFFGFWLFITIVLTIATYLFCVAGVSIWAFVAYDIEPFRIVASQLSWLGFRMVIATCAVVGAVIALMFIAEG